MCKTRDGGESSFGPSRQKALAGRSIIEEKSAQITSVIFLTSSMIGLDLPRPNGGSADHLLDEVKEFCDHSKWAILMAIFPHTTKYSPCYVVMVSEQDSKNIPCAEQLSTFGAPQESIP